MKITKEELIAENAKLKSELAEVTKDFDNYTDVARRNLAKTLGLSMHRQSLYGNKEECLPEWSEIYARIGALRTIETQKDKTEEFRQLESLILRHIEDSKTEPGND